MPKLIEDLRRRLLQTAKAQLLTSGYNALTMRGVAAACGVAVGTLYNYFPSKDALVAGTMLDDWLATLHTMEEGLAAAQSPMDALRRVYGGIAAYRELYSPAWQEYSGSGDRGFLQARHRQLLEQLAALLRPALERLAPEMPGSFCPYIAQLLLDEAVYGSSFEALEPLLAKLLQ